MNIDSYILSGIILAECAWSDTKIRAVPGHKIIAAIIANYISLLIRGETDYIITSAAGLVGLVVPSLICRRFFDMGEGDVLMLAMIGAAIGINGVMAFLVTSDICMLLYLLYTRKNTGNIPMAPFFFIGYIAAGLLLII